MMIKIRKKSSAFYICSYILSRAFPFLLLPILTAKLTQEDYGVIGVFATFVGIGGVYVGLRPDIYIVKIYSSLGKEDFLNLNIGFLWLVLATSIIYSLFVFVALYFFPIDSVNTIGFALGVSITCMLQAIFRIREASLQAEMRFLECGFMQMIVSIFNACLLVLFLYVFWQGWESKVIAEMLAIFLVLVIKFRYVFVGSVESIVGALKPAVKFLLPLTFHTVGYSLIMLADKVVIADVMGIGPVGIYTVAYTFGMVINVIHESISRVFSPHFYAKYSVRSVGDKGLLIFQLCYPLFSFVLWLCFMFIFPIIFSHIIDQRYSQAMDVVPIIALAFSIEGVRKIICGYIYVHNATRFLAIATCSVSIFNLVLDYFLVVQFGLIGAAYATVMSFSILTLIIVVKSYQLESSSRLRKEDVALL